MILDFIYQKRTLVGAFLIILILVGAALILFSNRAEDKIDIKENGIITVDIEGAVNNPGLYNLKKDSLIQDAINIAGGLSDNADLEKIAKEINRADLLKNNQKIYFPSKIIVSEVAGTANISGKINLNTATLEQLNSLPGIGPVYAQRIIDFRKINNGFSTIEDILEVEGIGEKTFEKIRDLITV